MIFAYLDTCIWLSAFFKRDVNHKKAIEIFRKARNDQYVILITHHVMNEILDVLKTKVAVKTRNEAAAEKLVRKKYTEFSTSLLKLRNVRIKNPNASTHQVFRSSFSLLFKYLKGIAQSNTCPICRNPFNYVESDTIFRDDALHVLIAWHLNCDKFLTFDQDFERLENENSLLPMQIEVL